MTVQAAFDFATLAPPTDEEHRIAAAEHQFDTILWAAGLGWPAHVWHDANAVAVLMDADETFRRDLTYYATLANEYYRRRTQWQWADAYVCWYLLRIKRLSIFAIYFGKPAPPNYSIAQGWFVRWQALASGNDPDRLPNLSPYAQPERHRETEAGWQDGAGKTMSHMPGPAVLGLPVWEEIERTIETCRDHYLHCLREEVARDPSLIRPPAPDRSDPYPSLRRARRYYRERAAVVEQEQFPLSPETDP